MRLSLAAALLLAGCARAPAPPDPAVHAITLPELPAPDLPDGPGRGAFTGACSTCHTTRYVVDQPALSRKTWTAEVAKMRKAYGAPFPEELSAPIVDYLATTHGTGD
ncbi:MAG TPA: hypothetical protein VIF09_27995 [Polyangiaceae bacterium]